MTMAFRDLFARRRPVMWSPVNGEISLCKVTPTTTTEVAFDMGSGNEREIFYVMLDKSTYLKKLALFSSQSVFFMYNIDWSNGILLFTELKSVVFSRDRDICEKIA